MCVCVRLHVVFHMIEEVDFSPVLKAVDKLYRESNDVLNAVNWNLPARLTVDSSRDAMSDRTVLDQTVGDAVESSNIISNEL